MHSDQSGSAEKFNADVKENSTKPESVQIQPGSGSIIIGFLHFDVTLDEVFEINDWLKSQGFGFQLNLDGNKFEKAPNTSYESYDVGTLVDLAESDSLANLELGERLFDNEGPDSGAEPYLIRSAADGYALPLRVLPKLYLSRSSKLRRSNDREGMRENLIESYAWDHVVNLRFFDSREQVDDNRSWILEEYRDDLTEIKEEAYERARDIYTKLQATRRERGKGEFNNYMPEVYREMLLESGSSGI